MLKAIFHLALFGLTNTGTGGAGLFAISNPASASPALIASTNGTGPAISATGAISATAAINTSSQYNINGSRVLGINGDSVFVGTGAGAANTDSESNNAFFGTRAAFKNNGGRFNSFFGNFSGLNNTTGSSNSFFGLDAGENNTTGGSNTFVGREAGTANTTGSNNTFIGQGANAHSSGLTFATALGSGAVVSSSDTIELGRADGSDTVQIPGDLNVTGAVNIASVNATSEYDIGGNRVLSIGGTNTNNILAGVGAGASNTGISNAFFGSGAGISNTVGSNDTFIGSRADAASGDLSFATAIGAGAVVSTSNTIQLGRANGSDTVNISGTLNTGSQYNIGGNRVLSAGGSNNFFAGVGAGSANTFGEQNAFFGAQAGLSNEVGSGNAFFGSNAGFNNRAGSSNAFFGYNAGASQAGLASRNAFFGAAAGQNNHSGSSNAFFGTSSGSNNSFGGSNAFFGDSAGLTNTFGSNNTFIGSAADGASGDLTFATALGAGARVSTSNTIQLGRADGSDTVNIFGKLNLVTLGAAGATPLCRNAANEISACAGPLTATANKAQVEELKYDPTNVSLVNAVKELRAEKDAQISALKAENAALRDQNAAMEARLTTLESKIETKAAADQSLASRKRKP